MVALGGLAVGYSPASADVNDFTFESFDATYTLGRSHDAATSEVHVVERIVADFPDYDQNHGILRAIPNVYQGFPLAPRVVSVTDGEGQSRPYSTSTNGDVLEVAIASDNFVHGAQTYVVDYWLSNVVLQPSAGGSPQEFYWDVNGTGWSQPFGSVTARVVVPAILAPDLNGQTACYEGFDGSATPCETQATATDADGAKVFDFGATNLTASQTLTFAVGFEAGTFPMPDRGLMASPFGVIFIASCAFFFLLVVILLVLRVTRWMNARGRGIIVPEYEAPVGATPLLAGQIFGKKRRSIAAAIIDLAVRGFVVIREEEGPRAKSDYIVERTRKSVTEANDREVLDSLFGRNHTTGDELNTRLVGAPAMARLRSLRRTASLRVISLGWRSQKDTFFRRAAFVLMLAAGAGVWFSGNAVSDGGYGGDIPFFAITGAWIGAAVVFFATWDVTPLTSKGALIRDGLKGLKMYISWAEADRLRFLQGPQGALRTAVDATSLEPTVHERAAQQEAVAADLASGDYEPEDEADAAQGAEAGDEGVTTEARPMSRTATKTIVKLYERALPFAILFGQESEWASVLSRLYEDTRSSPSWYRSPNLFDAVTFYVWMRAFTTSTTSVAWVGSSSSSSFGGSSGGGSAGGGGGGGGGGGL